MSVRLLVPLLLVCAGGGYLLGRLGHARWGDKPVAAPRRAQTPAALEALARIRAERDEARRDTLRHAFLERYPRSWLRARWDAPR